uniref:Methyltransferase n=1 Tax=Erysiphe necator associated polymycovirus 4 TaxID=2742558 RepID=A0A8E3YZK0_9VIRU|nr:methyltransferase [Erysiphe necator associated polymycovirus 4]
MPPKRFVMRGMRNVDTIGAPTTPTLTRTFSSESSGGSYGGPSVRSRTVAGKSTRRGGVNAGLPYPIFEFGFPKPSEVVPITEDSQFPPGPPDDYMRSEAGAKLRADEGRYNAMLRQFVVRNTRLTGSSLLFLGSGSSRNMLRLLRMSPAKAVFVDVDKAALDRLSMLIAREGLDATTQVEYVQEDAYRWLLDNASAVLFDTVIATKCVGQILKGDGRTFTEFVDRVGGVCRYGAHFYVDHHVYAAQFNEGDRLGHVASDECYDAATICARYSSDICYSCEVETPDFELVARFLSSEAVLGVQVWELYCLRFTGRNVHDQRSAVDFTSMPPAPTPFALPAPAGYDPVADSYLPANSKGVKRIPTSGDVRAYSAETCTPKIDGEPGLLILDGPTAVFISSNHRFVRPLRNQFTINIAFSCELVSVQRSLALLVVTGVVEQDGTACDPLDPLPMRHLEPLLDKFAQDGIIVNSPRLMRHIVGDSVALPGLPSSRPLDLPIDGIQVLHSGRGGVFIKPARLSTIDAKQSEALGLIEGAYRSIGSFDKPKVYTDRTGDREAVYEFARDNGSHDWVPIKARLDKQHSDTPGAIVHTLWALNSALALGFDGTVEDIRPKVAR